MPEPDRTRSTSTTRPPGPARRAWRPPRGPAQPAARRGHGRRRGGRRDHRRGRPHPDPDHGHRPARRDGVAGPGRSRCGSARAPSCASATRRARTPTPRSRSASRRCGPRRSAPTLDRRADRDTDAVDGRHVRGPAGAAHRARPKAPSSPAPSRRSSTPATSSASPLPPAPSRAGRSGWWAGRRRWAAPAS